MKLDPLNLIGKSNHTKANLESMANLDSKALFVWPKSTKSGLGLLAKALLASAAKDPVTYLHAQQKCNSKWNDWVPMMDEELAKMTKYGVWEEVDKEAWMNVLCGKWVHTQKGEKRKARWVARGFEQRNVDIKRLFAAVINKDTLRAVLAISTRINYEIDSVDIVSAFLDGKLEQDNNIFVYPPKGYNGDFLKLLKLNKSLYGLEQAPRYFNKKMDKWLSSAGFTALRPTPVSLFKSRGRIQSFS
jgi:hypothetical protein